LDELGFQLLVLGVLQLLLGSGQWELLRHGVVLQLLVARCLEDFAGHLEDLLHGLGGCVGLLLADRSGGVDGGVHQSFVGHFC